MLLRMHQHFPKRAPGCPLCGKVGHPARRCTSQLQNRTNYCELCTRHFTGPQCYAPHGKFRLIVRGRCILCPEAPMIRGQCWKCRRGLPAQLQAHGDGYGIVERNVTAPAAREMLGLPSLNVGPRGDGSSLNRIASLAQGLLADRSV